LKGRPRETNLEGLMDPRNVWNGLTPMTTRL